MGQTVNILGFVGHMVPVIPEFCHRSMQATTGNKQMSVPNNILFTKRGSVQNLAFGL